MLQFIFAFCGTLGFSIFFNCPKRIMFMTAVAGGMGWCVNLYFSGVLSSTVVGAFFGSFAVGILGEIFARSLKSPVTTFIIPGIITMVPGAGCYYTMLYIAKDNYDLAAYYGIQTILIAAAISTGIIISSYIGKLYNMLKYK